MRFGIKEGAPAIGVHKPARYNFLILDIFELVAPRFHSGNSQPSLLPIKEELWSCGSYNHRNQKRKSPDPESWGPRPCRGQKASGDDCISEDEELNQRHDLEQQEEPIRSTVGRRSDPRQCEEEIRQKNRAHIGDE